jgi:hypothetical protein
MSVSSQPRDSTWQNWPAFHPLPLSRSQCAVQCKKCAQMRLQHARYLAASMHTYVGCVGMGGAMFCKTQRVKPSAFLYWFPFFFPMCFLRLFHPNTSLDGGMINPTLGTFSKRLTTGSCSNSLIKYETKFPDLSLPVHHVGPNFFLHNFERHLFSLSFPRHRSIFILSNRSWAMYLLLALFPNKKGLLVGILWKLYN